jgi:hypothetical protein
LDTGEKLLAGTEVKPAHRRRHRQDAARLGRREARHAQRPDSEQSCRVGFDALRKAEDACRATPGFIGPAECR